ncbi:MAG: DJ-1/PfpI family protein [Bradyrhizobium sp.]
MAASVGVLVFNGYHELEFWYPVLRLREAGIAVSVLGVEGDQAAYSLLGYPVVPNAAVTKVAPSDFSAIVIPGGNVGKITQDSSLKAFLTEAAGHGATIAAISQAGALVPAGNGTKPANKTIVSETSDDLPQWTRKLLTELGH